MNEVTSINKMLLHEKNPDVRELLSLHRDVAMRECGHKNCRYMGGPAEGEHARPSVWCLDCETWV